jgi:hypothetical protein
MEVLINLISVGVLFASTLYCKHLGQEKGIPGGLRIFTRTTWCVVVSRQTKLKRKRSPNEYIEKENQKTRV